MQFWSLDSPCHFVYPPPLVPPSVSQLPCAPQTCTTPWRQPRQLTKVPTPLPPSDHGTLQMCHRLVMAPSHTFVIPHKNVPPTYATHSVLQQKCVAALQTRRTWSKLLFHPCFGQAVIVRLLGRSRRQKNKKIQSNTHGSASSLQLFMNCLPTITTNNWINKSTIQPDGSHWKTKR